MAVSDHIRKKLSQVPHKPGVYLHKDRFGTVIYVGKARDLRKRVSQYFHPSRRMGWDLKFNALVEAIHDFDFHVVKNEPESLLLESKLIKEFHPRYNISFRDDKRFLMVKINLNDPIPNFAFARIRKDDGDVHVAVESNIGVVAVGARRVDVEFARLQRGIVPERVVDHPCGIRPFRFLGFAGRLCPLLELLLPIAFHCVPQAGVMRA